MLLDISQSLWATIPSTILINLETKEVLSRLTASLPAVGIKVRRFTMPFKWNTELTAIGANPKEFLKPNKQNQMLSNIYHLLYRHGYML